MILPKAFLLIPKVMPRKVRAKANMSHLIDDEKPKKRRAKRKKNPPTNYADFGNSFNPTKRFKRGKARSYTRKYNNLDYDYRSNRPPKFNNESAKQCYKIL